jgi:hypothetical protein
LFLKLAGNDLESKLFESRYRVDLAIVKKPVVIWTFVAVVVLIGALVVVFVPGSERVSLTLLHYRSWPVGATLKLSNDTKKTITYLTAQGGSATLFVQKTADGGWTNIPLPVIPEMEIADAVSAKSMYVFVLDNPSSMEFTRYRKRELKPGQSAEIYVGLEPDEPPVRVGVVCRIPQGPVTQRLGHWIWWMKQQCHVKSRPPGQIEVWCSEPLQVSAKPTRAGRE